jgi:hypothetical protein
VVRHTVEPKPSKKPKRRAPKMATDLGYERLKKAVATPGTTMAEIQAAIILDMRDEDARRAK